MSEIDWSKVPEGYPIWIEDLKPHILSDMSGWHKEEEDRYVDEAGRFWNKPEEGFYRVYRNQNEAWTGTGLPPVGESCEYFDGGEWMRCEVVAHRNNAAVVLSDCYEAAFVVARELRPIRTQAQIEAEERERAIDEMYAIIREGIYDKYAMCSELYDAGFRKQGGAK